MRKQQNIKWIWLIASLAGSGLVGASGAWADGPLPVVDDCQEASYQDRTASGADRSLDWDYAFAGSPERCLRIRVGQSVHWVGNFEAHPLDPDQGDSPNPISAPDSNGVVTFTRVGVFGFRCNYHLEMRGAIHVVADTPPVAVPWGTIPGALLVGLLLLFIGYRAVRPEMPTDGGVSTSTRR